MTEPVTVHASSLSDWLDCPRRALLTHWARQDPSYRPRPRVEALVGTAAHRAAQAAVRQGPKDRGRAFDAAEAALDTIDWSPKVERELKYSAHTKTLRDAKRQARAIAHHVWRLASKRLPLLFECDIEAEGRLDTGAGIVFEGRVDWIDHRRKAVLDLKTGDDLGIAQLACYAAMHNAETLAVIHAPVKSVAKAITEGDIGDAMKAIQVSRSQAMQQFDSARKIVSTWLPHLPPGDAHANSYSRHCSGCRWRGTCIHYVGESGE